jgi:hypothetical protein
LKQRSFSKECGELGISVTSERGVDPYVDVLTAQTSVLADDLSGINRVRLLVSPGFAQQTQDVECASDSVPLFAIGSRWLW